MDTREYALAIIREQIQQQFDSRISLDNKASWLLGFLAVVVTVFFSTQKSKVGPHVLVLIAVLLLGAFVLAVLCLLYPLYLYKSPGVESFHDFIEENIEDDDAMITLLANLAEDHVQDFNNNYGRLQIKQVFLIMSYLLLLLSLILMVVFTK